MGLRERHHDVAAYALGVLEPADALHCEEHLARCVPCAVRLTDFTQVASALAQLADREPLRPGPLPAAVPLPRVRRWRRGLVAAAATLAVGVPGAALLVPDGDSGLRRVSATDPATGVAAAMALRDRAWGTEVALRVAGVRGPRVCELVVVGTDGRERPVFSWGVAVRDEEPVIEGGTALRRDEISRLEVRDRSGGRLVSVLP
ncbi:hypothetical protein [Streptomyces sp. NPDC006368]|uniref:anti-sigma factor family protein n=1 Tax=Streptomyces sp. NPDC006368 TaxID=3156760 RepID=UPI0033B62C58